MSTEKTAELIPFGILDQRETRRFYSKKIYKKLVSSPDDGRFFSTNLLYLFIYPLLH